MFGALPRSTAWWPYAGAAWTTAYGVIHVWWALGHAPSFPSPGESYFPGTWTPVVLALLSATVCLLIGAGAERRRSSTARWVLVVLGWVSGTGMLLYSFMFAISLVTLIFELDADWMTLLTRGSGVIGGSVTLAGVIAEQRRARHACPHCGRVPGHTPARRGDPAPRWAYIAGYATVVGCAVRMGGLVIDYLVTGRPLPVALGWSFSVFVVLLILTGTLLPLALVHRWGRIWPRWVMPFAGRDVPRWLVLGPALFVGAGLTGYFGVAGMTEMVLLRQGNTVGAPLWRILMEMLGYTVWGLGLLLAAISYHALTRSDCRSRRHPIPSTTSSTY